jgi:hypothetical protein
MATCKADVDGRASDAAGCTTKAVVVVPRTRKSRAVASSEQEEESVNMMVGMDL